MYQVAVIISACFRTLFMEFAGALDIPCNINTFKVIEKAPQTFVRACCNGAFKRDPIYFVCNVFTWIYLQCMLSLVHAMLDYKFVWCIYVAKTVFVKSVLICECVFFSIIFNMEVETHFLRPPLSTTDTMYVNYLR